MVYNVHVNEKSFRWEKYLKRCLQSTVYCCLATVDPKGVWSNPVYFAYDKQYNLYFISMPHSRHMKNIQNDNRVAISMYSTSQDTHGDVIGIQLEGKAFILSDKEVAPAHAIYYKRVHPDGKHGKKAKENMGLHATWKFVKVAPQHIYYFDTRFFGEERREVPQKLFNPDVST